jgi:hypothetical protein
MGELQRMTGQGCSYYLRGRCTRTRSPQASMQARCTLLEARREVGAQTLDRLERIKKLADPADREVARRHLIQKNITAINKLGCPKYVPSPKGGSMCVHQHLVYCIHLMPECQGRCDDYLKTRVDPEASGQGGGA